jgi:hypothetical protein
VTKAEKSSEQIKLGYDKSKHIGPRKCLPIAMTKAYVDSTKCLRRVATETDIDTWHMPMHNYDEIICVARTA